MLKKIIKHEWKSVNKIGGIVLLAILAVTLLGCIVLQTPVTNVLFGDGETTDFMRIIIALVGATSFFLYVVMLVGALYGIMIFLGVRFQKSMYGQEGYLTHTLPVSTHQILGGKIFVACIWMLFVQLVLILSVLALAISLAWGIFHGVNPDVTFGAVLKEGFEAVRELWESAYFEKGLFIRWSVLWLIAILINPVVAVLHLFGALTLGQLSRKHKILMGIVWYVVILIINSILESTVAGLVTAINVERISAGVGMEYLPFTRNSIIGIVVSVATAVILYFLSHHIITNKLNLE